LKSGLKLRAPFIGAVALVLLASCGSASTKTSNPETSQSLSRSWDGENWMRDRAEQIGDRPLSQLRIPGTHDAGTFSIPRTGAVIAAAQADTGTAQFAGIPEDFVIGAQLTQNATFTEQFNAGIRYLDFRVVCEPDGMFIVHTFRGMPIADALTEIAAWSTAHSQELILLDVQKNYGCATQMYSGANGAPISGNDLFTQLVVHSFGSALAKRPESPDSKTTLNALVSQGTNVVPFFIDLEYAQRSDVWWLRSSNALPPGAGMTNVWDPITTMPEMFRFLASQGPSYAERGNSQLLLASVATSPMFPKETGIAIWYSDWKAGDQVATLQEFIETTVLPDMPRMVNALARAGYNVLSTDYYNLGNWPDGVSFAQLVVDQN